MRATQTVSLSKQYAATFNPLSALAKYYNDFIHNTDEKVAYAGRNSPKIVTPFLDGLKCKFIIVQQIVLVCAEPKFVENVLEPLGFLTTDSVLPKTKEFSKLLRTTRMAGIDTVYNNSYGIELHIIPVEHWSVAQTANIIMRDLKQKEECQVSTFFSIYNTLILMLRS